MEAKRNLKQPKTENRSLETELQKTEGDYRQIFDNLPDAVFVYDVAEDGRIILANLNQLAESFGPATAKDIGKYIEDIYAPNEIERSYKVYNSCIDSGESITVENQLIDVIGQTYHVTATIIPIKNEEGMVTKIISQISDVTDTKLKEQERLANLKYFESMDRINRAMQGTNDIEQMMRNVLDETLSILDCDRAWLVYPIDPEAETWRAPMERTKPGYQGAMALGIDAPMNPDLIALSHLLLSTNGPVGLGSESEYPLPLKNAELFGFQSQLCMAIYPKLGKPWMFGLHQCSYSRNWSIEDRLLFQDIGRRLADALSSLLAYRDVQESGDRYSNLFARASDGICLLSLDGVIVSVNEAFAKMRGYETAELIGTNQVDMDTPETAQLFPDRFRRLMAGESLTFEVENYHKDGHIIPFEVSSSIIHSGGESYIQSFVRDITDRKKSEKVLREANVELEQHRHNLESLVEERTAELRSALDSSEKLMFLVPVAIFSVDCEYRISSWNRMTEEITGYMRDEVIGKEYGFLLTDFAPNNKYFYSLDAFNPVLGKEYVIRTKAGEPRTISVNADNSYDSDGNIIGGIWSFEDITERKQIEKHLTMMEVALENIGDGVEIITKNGGFFYVNAESCRASGYSREELLEMGVPSVDPYWNEERWPEMWEMTSKGPLTFEAEHIKKNGTIFPIEVTTTNFIYDGCEYIVAFVRDITERKQIEQRLIMGDIALERAREGIEILDESGHYTYVNAETCHSLGYTKEELLNMGVPDIDPYWDKDRWPEIWRAVVEKGVLSFEAEHRRKNGTVFPIEVVSSHFVYDGKDYVVTFTRDVTERKQLERKLVMADAALETAQEGIMILEENGNFVYVNNEYSRMLGYEREELSHMGIPEIDPFWNIDRWPEIWNAVVARAVSKFEASNQRKDGTIFPIEVVSNPFVCDGIDYTVALARDITERKQEEENARKREESLAEAMRIAQMADWELDLRNSANNVPVFTFNDRFYALLRTTAEKEGGYSMSAEQYFGKYLPSDEAKIMLDRLSASDSNNPIPDNAFEHGVIRGDGSRGYVLVKQIIIFDEQSIPVKILGSTQDITARKLAEEELKKAREDADRANQAKSMFLANMSHELRTPLNAILGFTQLMNRDETIPETARKNLAIINRSGEHLLSMINDVLDLSKIEAGKVELKEESFDFIRTIEDIGEMIRSRANVKGLSVLIELEPNVERYMRADLGKMRQILINLMGNAVKFTESGGIALRARMKKPERTSKYISESLTTQLEIEIQDTGTGIAKDKIDKIFVPFAQVGSIRASQMGTGLGLTISQSFAILMGGSISAESEEGKGSTFRLQVPVRITNEDKVSAPNEMPLLPVGLERGEPDRRILIVEDNTENAMLIETLLTRVGLSVRKAVNGKEGVEVAQEWNPHLIWMDMRMPVMNGYDAIKAIRASTWGKEMKIIAFTASVFSEQIDDILNIGCDNILHKPFRDWEVFELLVKHLNIRFKYSDKPATGLAIKPDMERVSEPTPADIKALSNDVLDRIRRASAELDKNSILDIVAELKTDHPEIAFFLEYHVSSYSYDEIEKLFESVSINKRKAS